MLFKFIFSKKVEYLSTLLWERIVRNVFFIIIIFFKETLPEIKWSTNPS